MRPAPEQVSQRPPGGVEGEAASGVAADFGLGQGGKKLADEVEDAEVGGGGGARGFTDGGLVHLDDGLKVMGAAQLGKGWGGAGEIFGGEAGFAEEGGAGEAGFGGLDGVGDGGVKDVAEEGGLTRATGAGDHDEAAAREAEVDVLEVAEADAGKLDEFGI